MKVIIIFLFWKEKTSNSFQEGSEKLIGETSFGKA